MLISFTFLPSGILFNGFSYYDEFFLFSICIGALLHNFYLPQKGNWEYNKIHNRVFLLFISYMIFQSFHGLAVLYSPRKIRWVLFFIFFLIVNYLIRKRKFPSINFRSLSLLISILSILYFGFYFFYGFIFEIFGVNRYNLQYANGLNMIAIWGTTAYVMFPIVIAMPCSLFLIKDSTYKYSSLGWVSVSLLILNSIYYDSRIGLLAIAIIYISSFTSLGPTKIIGMSIFLSIIMTTFFIITNDGGGVLSLMQTSFGIGTNFSQAVESGNWAQDMDRYIWTIVAFESISDSWSHFLFGHGFRTSGFVVAPYVYDWFQFLGKNLDYDDNVATEMFTNILVETGWVGLIMYSMNYVSLISKIIKTKLNPYRYILISSLLIAYFWMFIINMIDIAILYLILMPNGIIDQLNNNFLSEKFFLVKNK